MFKHIITVLALIMLTASTVDASIDSSIEKENFFNEDSGMSGFSKST